MHNLFETTVEIILTYQHGSTCWTSCTAKVINKNTNQDEDKRRGDPTKKKVNVPEDVINVTLQQNTGKENH